MPAPKASRPRRSRALLPLLPTTFSAPVSFSSGPWPRSRRFLELRGPIALLSRQAPLQPEAADTNLLVLSHSSQLSPHGSVAALVGTSCTKIWFATTQARDLFLTLARQAIRASATGIQRYSVLHELGHGASGVVHLVQRRSDGRHFALKAVPKADAFFSASRLSHLVAERVALSAAADSNSAFIVRLVDAFETPRHLCFVTELAGYGDFAHVLRQSHTGHFDEPVARKLFSEILLALEETHRLGYLYRDMKLDNLLLNESGHVRLADFGLVKKVDVVRYDGSVITTSTSSRCSTDSGSVITCSSSSEDSEDSDAPFRLVGRTHSFVGTRRYFSPEHLRGGQNTERGYGAPADIWAMGVTLYILLTGEYPFGRDVSSRNSTAMFNAIRKEEIKYPEWLSEDAVSMLKGLLNRSSSKRFDIESIKAHPWMSSFDWEQVRFDSANDVPQEDVLAVLREESAKLVDSDSAESKKFFPDADLFSSLSGGSSDSSKRKRKGVMDGYELLGFGYVSDESTA